MTRKIAVVTGTRAEYGLLTPLLDAVRADASLALQLIVTGMHLAPEFGRTIDEIRADGVPIADEVEMLLSSDTPHGVAKSTGVGVIGFADSFRRLQPDLVVVLGDRFEILAAATAATLIGIPIAHLHGGERTEGAIDESIRHAITKMSHLHFVSTAEYARRVVQLGEDPASVFHVGAIGLDRVDRATFLTKAELADRLGLPAARSWCTVTFHPVTREHDANRAHLRELLAAIAARPDLTFVFTKANADADGRMMNAMVAEFVAANDHAVLFDSLGSHVYLSLMAASALVLGNSSSGLLEAPYLRVRAIDVGRRQQGRVRPPSVLHVPAERAAIERALDASLTDVDDAAFVANPYYNGGAAAKIVAAIKAWEPSSVKVFHDIGARSDAIT